MKKDPQDLAIVLYSGPADYLPIVNYAPLKAALSILKGPQLHQPQKQNQIASLSTTA